PEPDSRRRVAETRPLRAGEAATLYHKRTFGAPKPTRRHCHIDEPLVRFVARYRASGTAMKDPADDRSANQAWLLASHHTPATVSCVSSVNHTRPAESAASAPTE